MKAAKAELSAEGTENCYVVTTIMSGNKLVVVLRAQLNFNT